MGVLMHCKSCGATIHRRDAFCAKCGELTERAQPLAQKIGSAVGALSSEFGKLVRWIIDYVSDEAHRKQVIAGGATIALLSVVLTDNPITTGVSSLFSGDENSPQLTDDGLPDFASYEDVFMGEEEEFIIMGAANVRDFPTSQGTTVTQTFSGGETVFAREVKAFDPLSQWFKLTSGGYVWGGNLESLSQIAHEAGASATSESDALGLHDLFGQWSDRATCYGEFRDIEFEVTFDGLFMNGERYNIDGAPDGNRFTFSTNDPDPRRRSQIAVVKTETDELLYVSFPGAMDLREFPFYPQGISCAQRAEYLNQ
ncbi:hypothetical protein GRI43_12540 [Altererythrobacter luteolus]|uniref:Zinc-ribbon domain-containing protein n=1 Tax=Pontixanthobacter luteolus TaxID=295089 RepID=A0A6I4V3C5_9SPHN|nr:hypothetical protein [Pontixanthobacter luteolus]MXP48215.1 hypothetical protein [Pontixanthobacter luteolus]